MYIYCLNIITFKSMLILPGSVTETTCPSGSAAPKIPAGLPALNSGLETITPRTRSMDLKTASFVSDLDLDSKANK